MTCYCSDMTVPPTVRVRKADGFFSCDKVCTSWKLTCATKRSHYSYPDEEESSAAKIADCQKVPDSSAHHYVCACDP